MTENAPQGTLEWLTEMDKEVDYNPTKTLVLNNICERKRLTPRRAAIATWMCALAGDIQSFVDVQLDSEAVMVFLQAQWNCSESRFLDGFSPLTDMMAVCAVPLLSTSHLTQWRSLVKFSEIVAPQNYHCTCQTVRQNGPSALSVGHNMELTKEEKEAARAMLRRKLVLVGMLLTGHSMDSVDLRTLENLRHESREVARSLQKVEWWYSTGIFGEDNPETAEGVPVSPPPKQRQKLLVPLKNLRVHLAQELWRRQAPPRSPSPSVSPATTRESTPSSEASTIQLDMNMRSVEAEGKENVFG